MPTQTFNTLGNDMMSKYNFLLQPIRDLTKNWDIDVATQLEEYLNEVKNDDKMCFILNLIDIKITRSLSNESVYIN